MEKQILAALLEKMERDEAAALITIVDTKGSSPGKQGFKMLVDESGSCMGTVGGGLLEAQIIKDALESVAVGRPRLNIYKLDREAAGSLGMVCGGETTVYIDVIAPPDTLVLVGAGHVARPLAVMAATAGFRVVVLDDRAEFCNAERFPAAERCLVGKMDELLDNLPVNRNTYIAVISRGHDYDQLALEKTVRSGAAYLGMIGSGAKVKTVFQELRGKGFSEEELRKVHAPIGLKIGARTAEEIAVSILAEIIAVKNGSAKKPG